MKRWLSGSLNTESATLGYVLDKQPKLTLFPQPVKSNATVYAVFSIE